MSVGRTVGKVAVVLIGAWAVWSVGVGVASLRKTTEPDFPEASKKAWIRSDTESLIFDGLVIAACVWGYGKLSKGKR